MLVPVTTTVETGSASAAALLGAEPPFAAAALVAGRGGVVCSCAPTVRDAPMSDIVRQSVPAICRAIAAEAAACRVTTGWPLLIGSPFRVDSSVVVCCQLICISAIQCTSGENPEIAIVTVLL